MARRQHGQGTVIRLLDRYLAAETLKRLGVALLVVLVALVLERILRLFDLVAAKGAPVNMVWEMAITLVPHYLGLALPAGFFISVFLVVSRLGEDNELDAMLSSGISPRRIVAPLMAIALALTVFSILLYGYIQPYSRYAYQAFYFTVTKIPWGATVPEWSFARVAGDAVVSAEQVDLNGRELKGVFVHMMDKDTEIITTAQTGQLEFSSSRSAFWLKLMDGDQIFVQPDGQIRSSRFQELTIQRDFSTSFPLFRPRGDSERELTLTELIKGQGDLPAARMKSELHGRLVRAASLPFLPLLAIPMGMAAKRSRRGTGIVVGSAILVIYHHVLQMAESLGDLGKLPAGPVLWGTMTIFALLCLFLFRQTETKSGENPVYRLLTGVEHGMELIMRRMIRRRGTS